MKLHKSFIILNLKLKDNKIYIKFKGVIKYLFKILRINHMGYIHKTAIIENKNLVKISNTAAINEYVIIRTYLSFVIIGENTQINPFVVIYGGSGVEIGNNVMIAPLCMIASGNHDYLQVDIPMRFAGNLGTKKIIIEDDVWIGANSTITDGVKLSIGSVISAGSVVTKDTNPYDIVAGVPARRIGNRKDNIDKGESGEV